MKGKDVGRRVSAVMAMLALTFSTAMLALPITASAGPWVRPSSTPSWASKSPEPRPVRELRIMTGFDSITEDIHNDAYRDELGAQIPVPHRFVVTALSGTGCDFWAPQMSELLNLHNPHVVLINCGTNDGTVTLEDRERFEAHYRTIIETIHAHNPFTYIIASKIQISQVDPQGPLFWLPDNEIRANEIIEFVMEFYISMWPTVGMVDFSTIEANEINNPDGIHPGPAGQQLYADLWFAEGQRLGAW